MTEQTVQQETVSRSRWSTALVSALGGPFGGFLWIGAGKLAVISLFVISAVSIALCYIGIPVVPGMDLAAAGNFSGIGLMILWATLVVPFAHRFKPDKWYAQGVSVFVLAFYASIVAAFVIRSLVFQSFSISSGSMTPTLREGDYLFVSKSAYGYSRYSVPFNVLSFDGRLLGAEPKRGDVVAFKFPPDPSVNYIQRIVGFPGEKIQIIDGMLYINEVAVGLEDIGSFSSEEFPDPVKLQRETLPEGVSYTVLNLTDSSIGDNTNSWIVPAGHYFALGDNRDNSSDSRFSVGFIPSENLVGKAVRLFWNSKGVDYSSRQVLDPSGK